MAHCFPDCKSAIPLTWQGLIRKYQRVQISYERKYSRGGYGCSQWMNCLGIDVYDCRLFEDSISLISSCMGLLLLSPMWVSLYSFGSLTNSIKRVYIPSFQYVLLYVSDCEKLTRDFSRFRIHFRYLQTFRKWRCSRHLLSFLCCFLIKCEPAA